MLLALDPITTPLQADRDGTVRVGSTRVTLDAVVIAFVRGASAEEIVAAFPSLSLPDVYATLSYYLQNEAAVTAYLREREAQASEIREQVANLPQATHLRDRLIQGRTAI
jgi:uncharacterized protein (DUF433 family)